MFNVKLQRSETRGFESSNMIPNHRHGLVGEEGSNPNGMPQAHF